MTRPNSGPAATGAEVARRLAGGVVILLMVVQITVVALRYVFSLGWPWAFDLLVYCFFVAALLPALAVLLGNVSVRVDVFYGRWSARRRRRVDRIALLALLCPTMGYAAWVSMASTIRSWAVLETSPTYGGLAGYFLLKTLLSLTFLALAAAALVMGLRRDPYGAERRDEP